MKLLNLTPHAIVLKLNEKTVILPVSGKVARVSSTNGSFLPSIDDEDGNLIPVKGAPVWGEVADLPDPQPGVVYIVSALVAGRVKRNDVLSPGTGPNDNPIRNEAGQVAAVTCLVSSV